MARGTGNNTSRRPTRESTGSGWTVNHRPLVAGRRPPRGYLDVSRRPLHVLVFLLPLVIVYEVGSAVYLADAAHGTIETIRAHSILLGFFQDFGIAGRFLPAAALVAVLLMWHVLNEDRWKLRPRVVIGMALESVVWTIPLVVLIALVLLAGGGGQLSAAAGGMAALPDMPWEARLTISVGAGLYEELLFRMIGIAALHLVLVDLARLSNRTGTAMAVLISAAAFAVYHDITLATGQIDVLKGLALLSAGVYFGVVYLTRGFGIVVGVHALYDIFVLVILAEGA
jgi:membrane protease YdiL (CAAX protease family)